MPWCEQCGAEVSADAKFCSSCGRAQPPPAAAVPDPTPETPPGLGPRERVPLFDGGWPDWARHDWPAALVAALIALGVCLAAGVTYGAIAGGANTSEGGGVLSGILTGAYLPFAMFGVETTAIRYAGDATLGFSFKSLPLPLAFAAAFGVYCALRFAWPRINRAPAHLLAFVVKLGLVVTVIATLLAVLLSFGDPSSLRRDGDGFGADVAVGSAALYPFVFVVLVGLAVLLWRRVRIVGGRVHSTVDTDVGRSMLSGLLAFVAIAAVFAVVVLIADLAVADSGQQKISTFVAFFGTGISRGIAATVFALGGAVERFVGHTSLFDWGSYERPGDSTAPWPLFAWLGLAPAAIAYTVLRRLDRESPAGEQGVARIAAGVVGGYVLSSVVLVTITGQDHVAAGSPRAAFGLALLWGLLGASLAGALWARSHGVRWQSLRADETGDPSDPWARPRRPPPTEIVDPPAPQPTLVDPDTETES